MEVSQYADHLYGKDLEGYIQVMQLRDKKAIKILNTNTKGIVEVIEEQQGQEDTYITPNSFYMPKRSNNNIRHFRALYIDLDIKRHSKSEAFYEVYLKVARDEIPKPSMIIDSGRGLHCYWRIEHAPRGAAYTWQELEDYLYRELKDLGADISATDSSRLLRLPNTINSKNGVTCEILEDNDIRYSMYDLREKYLNYVKKDKLTYTKTKGKAKTYKSPKRIFNSYTLNLARSQDIETIARLRGYHVTGYRNSIIHCYSYWKGIYTRESNTLLNVVSELNNNFTAPLRDTEIRAVVRSTERAIESFIEYEQGIRSGDDKRVSKAMKERGGYWYTNESLIEMLDITEEEQRQLKTIISTKEKQRRQNKARRDSRRNENGLTEREQSKADNISAVKDLAAKGLKQSEIARELNITQGYVSQIIDNE